MSPLTLSLCFILIFASALAEDCSPLYTRLFYDPSPAAQLKVDMIAMFNTLAACPDAYIHVKYLNSQDEFPCISQQISIDGPFAPYLQQYVHKCQVEIDSAGQVSEFTYSIQPQSAKFKPQRVELASVSLPFRILITSNTNMLDEQVYPPFVQAFQGLMHKRDEELQKKEGDNYYRINGIVINGGFAEGFAANKGQNFNRIMRMISQYSARWPLLINLGPTEYKNEVDFALIEKCFVLGSIGRGKDRTAMQGFSFARKANLAFLQTSSQFYNVNSTGTAEFNRTLSSLDSFLASNQESGNEFSVVFNHFSLFCSDFPPPNSSYNCEKGKENLHSLKVLLDSPKQYPPLDLYISSYQNNYERNYAYRNGNFMTLEQSRYKRGDFINLNEGTGGLALADQLSKTQKPFTAVRTNGKAGFGLLTIKGDGELRQKNQSDVIKQQISARKIYDSQKQMHEAEAGEGRVLSEAYLRSQDINELNLFLLNYKHLTIGSKGTLLIEDVFRIVTEPQGPTQSRHQLKVQN